MKTQTYKDLIVWQKSITLVRLVYEYTSSFPPEERFGLSSQMRRSAVSVPSNIAEGYKRQYIGEYRQFLSIADASLAELETQFIISKDIYSQIDSVKVELLLQEVGKMLIVLIRRLPK